MSLTLEIMISLVLFIFTWIVKGFRLYLLFPLIATIMFAVRKLNIHVKFNNIIVCEALPLFLNTMFEWLFKSFVLKELIIVIVLRAIFIGIVVYDSLVWVYIQEEKEVQR